MPRPALPVGCSLFGLLRRVVTRLAERLPVGRIPEERSRAVNAVSITTCQRSAEAVRLDVVDNGCRCDAVMRFTPHAERMPREPSITCTPPP